MAELDAVVATARVAGPGSPFVGIRVSNPRQAWSVREYDRRWPTQAEAIALHSETLAVTSRADSKSFSLVPKLIRWGIDLHMGCCSACRTGS